MKDENALQRWLVFSEVSHDGAYYSDYERALETKQ
jgi:hypothetical protein